MIIRTKLINLISRIFVSLNGDKLLRKVNRTPRVLFWHGIDSKVQNDVEAEIIDVEVFEKQIKYLNKYYEVISIEEFEKRFLTNSFTNSEVVLTFDDGYANNLYVVEPILNKYNLPYTVFISTEHIATGQYYPTSVNRIIVKGSGLKKISLPSQNISFSIETENDINNTVDSISNLLKTLTLKRVREITNDLINNVSKDKWLELQEKYNSVRPMNWDEVIELSNRKNVTIGSHCKYHICCHDNQDLEEIERQILESKQIIEDKLKIECNYFAYPNGDFTNSSNAIVRQAGYKMGFSTQKELSINNNNDLTVIPRIGVPQGINTFKIFTNIFPKR
jgi:peptidoglycan/xylan/chitin deacetylase (PgdA/CDA1 family)